MQNYGENTTSGGHSDTNQVLDEDTASWTAP